MFGGEEPLGVSEGATPPSHAGFVPLFLAVEVDVLTGVHALVFRRDSGLHDRNFVDLATHRVPYQVGDAEVVVCSTDDDTAERAVHLAFIPAELGRRPDAELPAGRRQAEVHDAVGDRDRLSEIGQEVDGRHRLRGRLRCATLDQDEGEQSSPESELTSIHDCLLVDTGKGETADIIKPQINKARKV